MQLYLQPEGIFELITNADLLLRLLRSLGYRLTLYPVSDRTERKYSLALSVANRGEVL